MRRPRPRHLLRLATSSAARRRWQRERWLDIAAARGVHAICVDDARGHRYFVDPRDRVIGRLLVLDGTYEHQTLDLALGLIDFEPDQIVDIGANIGTVSVELLSRYGEATAVAFEPDAWNRTLLAHNLLANDLADRTQVVPIALSDVDGSLELETSTENLGDHRVRQVASCGDFGEEGRATTVVPCRRFDSLVAAGVVTLSDRALVNLDVQGHEAHVLDGGPQLLSCPVVVEFWPYGLRRGQGFERLLAQLEGRTIIELAERPRELDVDALRGMELGTGLTDLLVMP